MYYISGQNIKHFFLHFPFKYFLFLSVLFQYTMISIYKTLSCFNDTLCSEIMLSFKNWIYLERQKCLDYTKIWNFDNMEWVVIMLREINQAHNDKDSVVTFICEIWAKWKRGQKLWETRGETGRENTKLMVSFGS